MMSGGQVKKSPTFNPSTYTGYYCPSPKTYNMTGPGCKHLEDNDITGDSYFACIKKGSSRSKREGRVRKDGKQYVHDIRKEVTLDDVKKSLGAMWYLFTESFISRLAPSLLAKPRKLPTKFTQALLDGYRKSIKTGGNLGAGFCFDKGAIFLHAGLLPFEEAKVKPGQKKADFCPTREGDKLVDRDCSCAVKSGGKECTDLKADQIQVLEESGLKKHAGVKALYFKSYETDSKGKVHRLPAPVLVAVPKGTKPRLGMKPAKLEDLKKLLSRRDDKGEVKLFANLKAKGIVRSKEMGDNKDYTYYLYESSGLTDYLAQKNEYDADVHGKDYVVSSKPSYFLSFADAKVLLESINADPKILADNNGQPLINERNFFIRSKTDEGAQYVFNCQPQVLYKIVQFLDKQIKAGNVAKSDCSGKNFNEMVKCTAKKSRAAVDAKALGAKKLMSLQAAKGLKKYLEATHILRAYRAPDMQKELAKDQKNTIQGEGALSRMIMYIFQTPALLIGLGSLLVFGLMIKMNKRQMRQMHDPEGLKRELEIKAAKKRLRRTRFRTAFLRKTLTPKEKLKVTEDLQLVSEGIDEKKMPEWQQQLKQLALRGEVTTDSERELLTYAPDWLVAGRDPQIRKFILATRNSGENAHPMVYGPSGSGKSYVQIGASNWIAAAWMWKYEPEKIKAALKKKYVKNDDWPARAKAINKIFEKHGIEKRYPETGKGMYDMQIRRYEEISAFIQDDDLDRVLATMDNTKLQTGTMYRGKQADKNAALIEAGEHRAVPNIQEVFELLKAGSTSGGEGEANTSEAMGNMLKHAMGAEDRAKIIRQLKGLPAKSINISADTTADRALRMARDEMTHDLNRRWAWIECNAWSPKETLEYMLDPGILEKLEMEHKIKIDPWAVEHAVRLGTKLMAPAGSGTLPRMAAARIINDSISLLKEKANGSTGTKVLTPDHIVEVVKREGKTITGDVANFGVEAMDLAAEHFVRPHDVRAMKDIAARRFSSAMSDAEYEKLITLELLRDKKGATPPIVKRIALSIISLKALGDYENNKAMETKDAVRYARKLYEMYERMTNKPDPKDAGEWAAFVNNGIEDVRPIEPMDHPELKVESILQEQIIRAMTPYKYASHEQMVAIAGKIEQQVITEAGRLSPQDAGSFLSPDSAEGFITKIPEVIEDFERGQELIGDDHVTAWKKSLEAPKVDVNAEPPKSSLTGFRLSDGPIGEHDIEPPAKPKHEVKEARALFARVSEPNSAQPAAFSHHMTPPAPTSVTPAPAPQSVEAPSVDPRQTELELKADMAARQANSVSLLMDHTMAKAYFLRQPHILNLMRIKDGQLLMPRGDVMATNDYLRQQLATASSQGTTTGMGTAVVGRTPVSPTPRPGTGSQEGLVKRGEPGIVKK